MGLCVEIYTATQNGLTGSIAATGHDIFGITMSTNDFFCRTDDIHTSVSWHVETLTKLIRKDLL